MCAEIIRCRWLRAYPGRSGGRILRDGVAFCGLGHSRGKNALEGQAGLSLTTVEHGINWDMSVHILEPA